MLTSIKHIFNLGVKEIIGIFRDPLLLMLIIYSFSLSVYLGAHSEPDTIHNAAIAIVDEDKSALTQRLSDSFLPPMFRHPDRISRASIDEAMDSGRYTFVLVFPPNFQERVLANNRPEIQVNIDATQMSQAFTGNGYIQEILLMEINKFIRENTSSGSYYPADAIVRNRFNPNITHSWNGAVSELVNNIFMIAMVLTGAALIRERERGTLEHLLVTPVRPVEIMISKVWSMSLIVFVTTSFSLIYVVHILMGIPIEGSVVLFLTGVLISLFSITSLGIFIACYAKDMPQLGMLMILVLMPMEILSGGGTPIACMPEVIQKIMVFAPTTYLTKLSRGILFRGADLSMVWTLFLQVFLLGCFYFFIALKRFRKTVAS